MPVRFLEKIITIILLLSFSACSSTSSLEKPGDQTTAGKDPQNASYLIEGEIVSLQDGKAEKELAPGSASKQETRYLGNELKIDLNSDHRKDFAFFLIQETGGSGSFYYVAAALNNPDGYLGTNAIFLGDRIAPLNIVSDPDDPAQFIVTYADRAAGDPMSAKPTNVVSRTFRLQDGLLTEVGVSPTQTPLGFSR